MSVRTPKTLLQNKKCVCGLTHSFIKWTNLTWSQMGDLSKIVFFSKTAHKPCYIQSNKLCIILGTAGTLCMKTHFLLDLKVQIKVTISEYGI